MDEGNQVIAFLKKLKEKFVNFWVKNSTKLLMLFPAHQNFSFSCKPSCQTVYVSARKAYVGVRGRVVPRAIDFLGCRTLVLLPS
jgi:hypothetical protein